MKKLNKIGEVDNGQQVSFTTTTLNELIDKINEIIDALNQSQKQPEGEHIKAHKGFLKQAKRYNFERKAGKDSTIREILDNGYKIMYADKEKKENEVALETYRQATTEKQEEWREELLDLIDGNGRVEDLEDVEVLYVAIRDFISQLLSERTREAKIQQLKEDMEQVEVFLPENTSDTEKYWIPTQILLELEDDLSKLLRGRL